MEEIQKKLSSVLNYPRSNAPAQSLLFAGAERYALLEWLFFRSHFKPPPLSLQNPNFFFFPSTSWTLIVSSNNPNN